jgi:regulatory protein
VGDDAAEPPRSRHEGKSLLSRALGWLARREHSRAELARKLAPYAESSDEVRRLLDEIEAKKLLSDRRFTEALVRRRGERLGSARVGQELRERGVGADLLNEAVDGLRRTELQRARAVWKRKFGVRAADARERARQMRFLAQRGFDAEVIRRVVAGGDED